MNCQELNTTLSYNDSSTGANENTHLQRRVSSRALLQRPFSAAAAIDHHHNNDDLRRPRDWGENSSNLSPVRRRGSQSSPDDYRVRRLSRTVTAIEAVLALLDTDDDEQDFMDEDGDEEEGEGQHHHHHHLDGTSS